MKLFRILNPIKFILGAEVAGMLGGFATFPAIKSWYVFLAKPSFTPPSWAFGPAWTILYALMGFSAYLLFENRKKKGYSSAMKFFVIQFVLNIAWSFIFFGARQPKFALIEILILWIFILLTIIKSYKVSKTAGLILIPYLLWVSFATALNWGIVMLNGF